MALVLLVLLLVLVSLICGFLRVDRATWTAATGATLLLGWLALPVGWLAGLTLAVAFAAGAFIVNQDDARRRLISGPALDFYRGIAPRLSATERTAMEAGTVGWEAELFAGRPDFRRLLAQPAATLSASERDFLDGPCETACRMTDDWQVTHEDADLSPETWEFLKEHKFFGMIIPRQYGGLGFSAAAHSAVLQKLASRSATLASTVAVPNSLGPAELLLHYGTDDQKNFYLPRLARGEELPCFGLTGPTAGSDATSIPDVGVVTHGTWEGEEVLGMRLTLDKRYITLAPVATVIGLAFQLRDPDHLIGDDVERGITLALIPRDTPGLEIGRRHFPLNTPFQNGPIAGKDIFVPLSFIIGGQANVGRGWRMLVEVLSVGRGISLPSNVTGASKAGAFATGAYARMRRQFNLAIGRFEGIEEALARIAGFTYVNHALSSMCAATVDQGEKPAVSSAIAKYHCTELAREIARDVMDIHAGKAVVLGPRNYAGRGWESAPIAVTVEGANIMTRSLMIFGQGAIRCHPYVLQELSAALDEDRERGLKNFDRALFGHIGVALSNASRALLLGLTGGRLASVPGHVKTRRLYRRLARYSAALGLASDAAMLSLGGKLKFKETLSARLGDVLSQLYIVSAVLKKFDEQGEPESDLPFVTWACFDAFHKVQVALDGFLLNLPMRPLAWKLRALIFPLGRRENPPGDRLGHRVAGLLLAPNAARDRLVEYIYRTPDAENLVGRMDETLKKVIATEPLERQLSKAVTAGTVTGDTAEARLVAAVHAEVLSAQEAELIRETRAEVAEIIAVDDFTTEELAAGRAADGATPEAEAA